MKIITIITIKTKIKNFNNNKNSSDNNNKILK